VYLNVRKELKIAKEATGMVKKILKPVEPLIPVSKAKDLDHEEEKSDVKVEKESKHKVQEIKDFEIHMLTNKRSPRTIKTYLGQVSLMLQWINKPVREITLEDLEKYKTYMSIEKEYSKASMYIHIKAIQAFFLFLEMNIAEKMIPPKRSASLPKYLSEEEMARIFEAARNDEVNGIRDYAIITVLGFTGLRLSELCNLNIEDIDFSEKTIKVRSGKGDKDRVVIFEEKTEEALKKHLTYKDRHFCKNEPSALFVSGKKERIASNSVEVLVTKYAKIAGINKVVTPHVLRHTMATTLLKHGADIRIIQQLLGHSSIATTMIYTHVDEGMLKKAYDKSKPEYK
jgi:integrase/recombinase XerD